MKVIAGKTKQIIPYFIIAAVGILLINLIASNHRVLSDTASGGFRFEVHQGFHLLGTLYCVLLGFLLEWRSLMNLFTRKRRFRFSPSLIPGLILLLISAIAPATVLAKFGPMFGYGIVLPFPDAISLQSFLIGPLQLTSGIQNLLAVVAGSMIVKGATGLRRDSI